MYYQLSNSIQNSSADMKIQLFLLDSQIRSTDDLQQKLF